MKVVWSPAALEDLKAAVDYIEFDLDSPRAAERFYQSVLERVRLFGSMPDASIKFRTARGIDTGFRYIIYDKWMIFTSCENDQVLVVRILFGKSDYMQTLFGDIGTPTD